MSFVLNKGKRYFVVNGELKINDQGIKDINDIIGLRELLELEELDLSNNEITKIRGLEELSKLKILLLSSNKISKIEHLDNLKNLEFLSLGDNQISKIENLENLGNLRTLLLGDNKIREIENLDRLSKIEHLYLFSNEITKIKGLKELNKLKTLSLSSNKISKIEHLDNLKNLESLLLSDNQISKIENLENLEKLLSLSLGDNIILEIENLDSLSILEQLDLSRNRITEIKGLEILDKLSELDLENNKIEIIEGLENLRKLEIIYLERNNLKPPDDIWAQKFTKGSQIVYYCRCKRRGEIERSGLYSDDKTHSEKIKNFKQELKLLEKNEFVNIGTHNEKENISWKQNMIFYEFKPYSKRLGERDFNIKKINIFLNQLHSLKGIKPSLEEFDFDYSNKYFDFFIRHFWDKNEIQNNVLVYKDFTKRISIKIDEFLDLCVKDCINKETPSLLIFPENSIPYEKLKEIITFSIENNTLIIGGIEHLKTKDNNYNNIAFIIDNGKIGYQLKQTPVSKKNLENKEIDFERIICQSIPKINIFETTIGNIAIFICKDFLRLCDIISEWAWKNDIDFIIIPSLTSKVLPFHYKLLNIFNYTDYKDLKVIFNNIGEYGGSELFTLNNVKIIEEKFRTNIRDNLGEVIVRREYKF